VRNDYVPDYMLPNMGGMGGMPGMGMLAIGGPQAAPQPGFGMQQQPQGFGMQQPGMQQPSMMMTPGGVI